MSFFPQQIHCLQKMSLNIHVCSIHSLIALCVTLYVCYLFVLNELANHNINISHFYQQYILNELPEKFISASVMLIRIPSEGKEIPWICFSSFAPNRHETQAGPNVARDGRPVD